MVVKFLVTVTYKRTNKFDFISILMYFISICLRFTKYKIFFQTENIYNLFTCKSRNSSLNQQKLLKTKYNNGKTSISLLKPIYLDFIINIKLILQFLSIFCVCHLSRGGLHLAVVSGDIFS